MDKKEKLVLAGAALFFVGFGLVIANALLPALLGESAGGIMELTTLLPLILMPAGGLLILYVAFAVRD